MMTFRSLLAALAASLVFLVLLSRPASAQDYPNGGGGGGGRPSRDCHYVCFVDNCTRRKCYYTCNRPRYCEDPASLLLNAAADALSSTETDAAEDSADLPSPSGVGTQESQTSFATEST